MAFNIVQVNDRVWQFQAPFGPSSKLVHTRLVLLYLVKGSKLALIDTGTAQHPEEVLRPGLKQLGYDLSDVSCVLITHGNHDHLGGNGVYKRESPNTQFMVHRADVPFAESADFHVKYTTALLHQFGKPEMAVGREKAFEKTLTIGTVDRVLEDGDRIDLGEGVELTAVHTPGHTPGSTCYYWEAEKLLFSGDAVQGRGSYAGGYPMYNDAADYRRSIDRLLGMQIETLCLGHPSICGQPLNPPLKRGADARDMLEDSATVARDIDEAVRARIEKEPEATDLEIAQRVVIDLLDKVPAMIEPALKLPAAAASLAAHIREARTK